MTAKSEQKPASIYAAFVAAQREMSRAIKDTPNPHFKSKYADLAGVQDACLPALHDHGFAVIQPLIKTEDGYAINTLLIHETGETLQPDCPIPLIIGKNDMQGLGSAITYARRYGLFCMAGVAPEDDDGNLAAQQAPRNGQTLGKPVANHSISADQYTALRDLLEETGANEAAFLKYYGAYRLETFPAAKFDAAKAKLEAKRAPAKEEDNAAA